MRIAVCGPATLSMLESYVVGHIASNGYPFPGTSELILDYLRMGHSVVLITSATDISEPQIYKGKNLEIHIVPSRSRARARALDLFRVERRGVADAIRRAAPDVIHAHWTYEFAIPSRLSGVPSLVTVHDWGPSIALQNKHLYWYLRALMQVWCMMLPGEFSAPTLYLAKRVKKYYRRECHVIPNGVDLGNGLERDADQVRPLGRVGMLNVGFSEGKNVKSALRAWKIVNERKCHRILFLAGPGYEDGGPAHIWARENKCDRGVIFEGIIEPGQRRSWYEEKTLFLHTSRVESFGMVLIEAMAAMTPVIAGRDSGAVPEVTQGAALLVDINDPVDIAFHVDRLLDNDAERREMSDRGREVARLYDKRVVADRYLNLLDKISRTGAPSRVEPK